MSFHYLFKVILIGEPVIEKSNLLLSFADQHSKQNKETTIYLELGSKVIKLDGLNIKLQIWNIAESFQSITRSFFRNVAGVIVAYDVTKRESYENAARWIDEVKQKGDPKLSMLLVGIKGDFEQQQRSLISYNEALQQAKDCGIEFFETSSKVKKSVEEIFIRMTQMILEKVNLGEIDPQLENFGVKLGREESAHSHGNKNTANLMQLQQNQHLGENTISNTCW
ncbi:unnamed protein product (macronuclear) [Paramecium tetraurelia]|uniref:Chromosome undetermined scaffold_107, whole genome shotgun sequence n=1 Tax=Paramecium tetraurelia TaxID=5888 RepID=Q3SD52_PARTE|nr:uncharacterized protein GSPATT00028937001 [Paramecium tetraurelia]CAI44513.1 rab_C14 [Paramecium tetraurelia]CAK57902.1 unnamed protein product [Paramecium tetraurelia]|eukprot:XP_001425300.1 hypothetical protein (macronuclear) [Paramecium tetraurelia strain d4-2]